MGACRSRAVSTQQAVCQACRPGLADLPVSCIAVIMGCLAPKDICKLALVSRSFREAALSDQVWIPWLPHDWIRILGQSCNGVAYLSSRKQLYDLLCTEKFLQNGTKKYWLDRATGGVCQMLSARALQIVSGNDARFWEWIPCSGSRFSEVAWLKQVWWFEIRGSCSCELPPGKYTVSFRIQPVDAKAFADYMRQPYARSFHGWERKTAKFMLTTEDGQHCRSERYLDEVKMGLRNKEILHLTNARFFHDKWMEYDTGEFVVVDGTRPSIFEFSMLQVDCTHLKGGLFVDGVLVRPSHLLKGNDAEKLLPQTSSLLNAFNKCVPYYKRFTFSEI